MVELFDEFQILASRTAQTGPFNERLCNYAMGLIGESGEVRECVQKAIFQGQELDKIKLADELGDMLWYLSSMATILGLSLRDIANGNIEKLRRRYPEVFSAERSVNR